MHEVEAFFRLGFRVGRFVVSLRAFIIIHFLSGQFQMKVHWSIEVQRQMEAAHIEADRQREASSGNQVTTSEFPFKRFKV